MITQKRRKSQNEKRQKVRTRTFRRFFDYMKNYKPLIMQPNESSAPPAKVSQKAWLLKNETSLTKNVTIPTIIRITLIRNVNCLGELNLMFYSPFFK